MDCDDGLREDGGIAGGFFPIGGAGFGLGGVTSGEEATERGDGRAGTCRLAIVGIGGAAPGIGGAAPGGLGGVRAVGRLEGIRGAEGRVNSESDRYAEPLLAPVFTPLPVFLNLGMPPASMPANCGACGIPPVSPFDCATSLLLRARFVDGGARPGTGGAEPTGGPLDELALPSIKGAERSLVTVCFSLFPFSISPSRPAYTS